jgi:hypothetical protein
MVNVTILDINDNCPMFVNLPYYAVVSVDAQKGDVITKVRNRVYCQSEDILNVVVMGIL